MRDEELRAVVLAGGKGTRLMPYTAETPKALLPLGRDQTIMGSILQRLRESGFSRVTLAINHGAKLIQDFFGDGTTLGISIDYSQETEDLGTMGPLRLIEDLPENFLVINGDVLCDLNYSAFLQEHAQHSALITIAGFRHREKNPFGVLQVEEGTLIGFEEKPETERLVSAGIYAVNRALVDEIEPGMVFGFDQMMVRLLAAHKPIRVTEWAGYWLDIGRPADYEQAKLLFGSSQN